MSQPGNKSPLLTTWTTVRGSSPVSAPAPDEWLDLNAFADVAFWIDVADPTPPEPEPVWRRAAPEFQGMRILQGDRWVEDRVPFVDDDGRQRWRVIRVGDSRGRRRGAVIQRAPRRGRP